MNLDRLSYWAKYKVTLDESKIQHCRGISYDELAEHAGKDWNEIRDNPAALKAFADIILAKRLIKVGIKPPDYNQASHCQHCGWIWSWSGCQHEMDDCHWCQARENGIKIPHPPDPNYR